MADEENRGGGLMLLLGAALGVGGTLLVRSLAGDGSNANSVSAKQALDIYGSILDDDTVQ